MPTVYWVGILGEGSRSVGDQAQTLAVQQLIQRQFSDYKLKRYSIAQAHQLLKEPVTANDLILIHSGGSFGDLYGYWHTTRKQIIQAFRETRIIQLPVSVHYSSPVEFEKDKVFFTDKPLLTILCRHKSDVELLKANFSCHVEHYPDLTCNLEKPVNNQRRKGVLFVLRNDRESVFEGPPLKVARRLRKLFRLLQKITGKDIPHIAHKIAKHLNYQWLRRCIQGKLLNAHVEDVQVSSRPITNANREAVVQSILQLYGKYWAVVTDRFHALVFAMLTDTKAYALPTLIKAKTTQPNLTRSKSVFKQFRKRFISEFQSWQHEPPVTYNNVSPVLSVIKSRRTIRKFALQPVELRKLYAVVEAGVYAPTGGNTQAVKFMVVTDPATIEKLCECSSEWLRNSTPAVVTVVCYDVKQEAKCGIKLDSWMGRFMWQDTAAAMMCMMLTAESAGLKSCWASINPPNARKIHYMLQLPRNVVVACMLLLGYGNQQVDILKTVHLGKPIKRCMLNVLL